jgi:hypothetical protein
MTKKRRDLKKKNKRIYKTNKFFLAITLSFFFIFLLLFIVYYGFTGNIIKSIDENYYWNGTKGVCVHYDPHNDLTVIKGLRVQMIRDEIAWGDIETTKGVYDFSYYDLRINQSLTKGIESLYIIDYSNCLYNNMPSGQGYDCWLYVPRNVAKFETFKEAYGNYTYEVVKHYKGKVKYFELWNEPNIFWQPMMNDSLQATQYIELMKEGYTRAKEANPDAIILSAGIDTWSTDLIDSYIKNYYIQGAKNYFDILAIHPYCSYEQTYPLSEQGATCDAIENIAYIKNIMDFYNDSSKKIWITEFGYPTAGCYDGGTGYCEPNLSEENQNIRMKNIFPTLAENYPYVTGFFWYDYMDDCGNETPLDTECRFGLVRSDLSKKPAYYTYQNISSSAPIIVSTNTSQNSTEVNNSINNSTNSSTTNTSASSVTSFTSSSSGGGGSSGSIESNNSVINSSNSSDTLTSSSINKPDNMYSSSTDSYPAKPIESENNGNGKLIVGLVDKECNISNVYYRSGYIRTEQYCDKSSGEFLNQKEINANCENSFECLSNSCVSNKCSNESFISKILGNVKKFFGI